MLSASWFRITAMMTLIAVSVIAGCTKKVATDRPDKQAAFEEPPIDYALVMQYDISGSFYPEMVLKGRAFTYSLQTLDAFQRECPGSNPQLILSHISGSTRPVLWQGRPRELKKKFSGPAEMRAFLERNNVPGSRVYDSVRETIEHLLSLPGVREKKVPTMLLVYSDMEDTCSDNGSRQRLMQALRLLATEARSAVGLFFVADAERLTWERHLRDAGFPDGSFIVVAGMQESARLPRFKFR